MRLLLLLGVLCALATPAVHAQGQPRLQVRQLGWQGDGSLSSGSWNPVLVHVTGSAQTNDVARVLVVLKLNFSSNSGRTGVYPLGAYGQDVALPPGVDKDLRIWVYVPSDGAYIAA